MKIDGLHGTGSPRCLLKALLIIRKLAPRKANNTTFLFMKVTDERARRIITKRRISYKPWGQNSSTFKQLNPKNIREEGHFLIGITGCR